ncbi:hypothetical protein BTUL_0210g00210 [Botrytis tulipae]|uniref:Uncharacterized protein n=1 Tax=Botrytis tulipae TaxID=87230 RepID=A0A4Z1EDA4_9HELO|nr:hypothetical protein BTUL_0210g00210 [Botrytis tulipae]
MKYTPLSSFIFLTTFFEITNASFNFNNSAPDWDYVAKDLANTTSQACIAAHSADIDCDDALLGFVASERPTFKPTSTDFENTCTTICFDSGYKEACTADGDAAYENVRGTSSEALVPVEIVAQVFQYALCGKAVESATLNSAMTMPTSTTSVSSSGTNTIDSASRTGTGSSISSSAVVSAELSSPTATSVTTQSGALKIGLSLGLAFLGMSYSTFFM